MIPIGPMISILTARIGGSRLRSMGFMMMKTCWFLWVKPVSSLKAALQKYCTQPCLPRKVEGRPRGKPNLNGKLWIPADNKTDSPPVKKVEVKFFVKDSGGGGASGRETSFFLGKPGSNPGTEMAFLMLTIYSHWVLGQL